MKLKKEWAPPTDLDPQCLDLCTAMNKLPGIRTTDSCCGHGKSPYRVFFMPESLKVLPPLLFHVDSCHVKCQGWRVIVYTDCSMCPAHFMLEGPVGEQAYEDSKAIARAIEGFML